MRTAAIVANKRACSLRFSFEQHRFRRFVCFEKTNSLSVGIVCLLVYVQNEKKERENDLASLIVSNENRFSSFFRVLIDILV